LKRNRKNNQKKDGHKSIKTRPNKKMKQQVFGVILRSQYLFFQDIINLGSTAETFNQVIKNPLLLSLLVRNGLSVHIGKYFPKISDWKRLSLSKKNKEVDDITIKVKFTKKYFNNTKTYNDIMIRFYECFFTKIKKIFVNKYKDFLLRDINKIQRRCNYKKDCLKYLENSVCRFDPNFSSKLTNAKKINDEIFINVEGLYKDGSACQNCNILNGNPYSNFLTYQMYGYKLEPRKDYLIRQSEINPHICNRKCAEINSLREEIKEYKENNIQNFKNDLKCKINIRFWYDMFKKIHDQYDEKAKNSKKKVTKVVQQKLKKYRRLMTEAYKLVLFQSSLTLPNITKIKEINEKINKFKITYDELLNITIN